MMSDLPSQPRRQMGVSWFTGGALLVWLVVFAAISGDVARKPDQHTTMPTYRFATTQWWRGLDPYTFDQTAAPPPAASPSEPSWMTRPINSSTSPRPHSFSRRTISCPSWSAKFSGAPPRSEYSLTRSCA